MIILIIYLAIGFILSAEAASENLKSRHQQPTIKHALIVVITAVVWLPLLIFGKIK